MKQKWYFRGERALGLLKYIIALFMILAGVLTPLQDLTPHEGALGFIYHSRLALTMFGAVFFLSGATLLYGKVYRNKKITGLGLFLIFICFFFSGILETVAEHRPSIGNFVCSFILAALYLRWRIKTAYIDPNHFKKEIDNIRQEQENKR